MQEGEANNEIAWKTCRFGSSPQVLKVPKDVLKFICCHLSGKRCLFLPGKITMNHVTKQGIRPFLQMAFNWLQLPLRINLNSIRLLVISRIQAFLSETWYSSQSLG